MKLKGAELRVIEDAVKHIALSRRTTELRGKATVEEFDEMLNDMCAKWYKKFASMDQMEIAGWMVVDLFHSLKEVDTDGREENA